MFAVAGIDGVFVPQAQDQVGFEEGLGGSGVAEGAGHRFGSRKSEVGSRNKDVGMRGGEQVMFLRWGQVDLARLSSVWYMHIAYD